MSKTIDVQKEIQLHFVTDGPAKGWCHTHGMVKFGQPELEIRNVPSIFMSSAASILNHVADYMLNHAKKPVKAGHNMEIDRVTIIHFEDSTGDEERGFDLNHYTHPVLLLTGIDPVCSAHTPKTPPTKAQA